MATFSLETIVGHLRDHPILEPNRYEVIITGPVEIDQYILFNAHACGIPGTSIGSFEGSIVGPKRKLPNEEIYDDLSITFYNNHHIDEMYKIRKWMKLIGGDDSYRISYYNDIIADINIIIYDLRENKIAEVKFTEAYPIGVSELELSYAGEAPSDITVNFAYHTYEIIQKKH